MSQMSVSRLVSNSHIYAMKNMYLNNSEGDIGAPNTVKKHDDDRNKTDVSVLFVVIPFKLS